MLHMCFYIDEIHYAVPARSIESVIPYVNLQPSTEHQSHQIGSLVYKQQLVPIFDLCQILLARCAESMLSTRILLLGDESGYSGLYGIIVERATGMINLADTIKDQASHSSSSLSSTVYGKNQETIQLLDLARLHKLLLSPATSSQGTQALPTDQQLTDSAP